MILSKYTCKTDYCIPLTVSEMMEMKYKTEQHFQYCPQVWGITLGEEDKHMMCLHEVEDKAIIATFRQFFGDDIEIEGTLVFYEKNIIDINDKDLLFISVFTDSERNPKVEEYLKGKFRNKTVYFQEMNGKAGIWRSNDVDMLFFKNQYSLDIDGNCDEYTVEEEPAMLEWINDELSEAQETDNPRLCKSLDEINELMQEFGIEGAGLWKCERR